MTSVLPASDEAVPVAGAASTAPHMAGRLDWIEVGRGLAALGVVLAHFSPWRDPAGHPWLAALRPLGSWGVEFFFVLSGFIILYVHAPDLNRPAALPRYIRRRLVRILPTYWLVLALAMLANQTVQVAWTRQALTFGYVARQIFLLPGELMVGQAWTLRHEFLFYGVFLLMILRLRVGLAVFGGWMALALGNLIVNGLPPGFVEDACGIVLHHYNIDFVIGMGVALAARREALIPVVGALWLGAALIGGAPLVDATGPLWYILSLKLAFGGVVGAAVIVSRRGVPATRVLMTGGAISYALYISHEFSGTALTGVLRRLHWAPGVDAVVAAKTIVAIVFALLLHRFYEKPIMRLLNAIGQRRPVSDDTGPEDHASSNKSTAFAAVADSRTVSPSIVATRPAGR